MKRASIVLFFLILIVHFHNSRSYAQSTGDDILKQFFQENDKIASIDCTLEQIIYENGGIEKYKGRYRSDKKGRFRIDYHEPSIQTVVYTSKNLLWHIPASDILYVIKNFETADDQFKLIHHQKLLPDMRQFMQTEYLGIWPTGFFTLAHHFVLINSKNGLKLEITFSVKDFLLQKKRIVDRDGKEILKELYSEYMRINSTSFPMRVDVYAKTKNGYVRSISLYRDIQINKNISDDVFIMRVPKKTRVMSYGEHR